MENNIFDKLDIQNDFQEMTMDSKEYLKDTKELLNKCLYIYNQAFIKNWIKEDTIINPDICDKCNGNNNNIKINNEIIECFQDREEGDCFYMQFDKDGFIEDFNQLFEDIMALIQIDKLTNHGE